MTAAELYARLRSTAYVLFPKADGRLGIRGPRPVPTELMTQVRRLKAELLQLAAISDACVVLHRRARAAAWQSGEASPGRDEGR